MSKITTILCRTVAALHGLAGAVLMQGAFDPYFGNLQNFPFPCEPCGWLYDTKEIYFLSLSLPGGLLLACAAMGWRASFRTPRLIGLLVGPALVYLWMFANATPE